MITCRCHGSQNFDRKSLQRRNRRVRRCCEGRTIFDRTFEFEVEDQNVGALFDKERCFTIVSCMAKRCRRAAQPSVGHARIHPGVCKICIRRMPFSLPFATLLQENNDVCHSCCHYINITDNTTSSLRSVQH